MTDFLYCSTSGIVSSSPGLRGTSYPGLGSASYSTPKGLPRTSATKRPHQGCCPSRAFPEEARSSQPWTFCQNPFGLGHCHFGRASWFLAALLALTLCPLRAETNLVVASDGSGQFKSVQEAIMIVPAGSASQPVVIH